MRTSAYQATPGISWTVCSFGHAPPLGFGEGLHLHLLAIQEDDVPASLQPAGGELSAADGGNELLGELPKRVAVRHGDVEQRDQAPASVAVFSQSSQQGHSLS